MKNDDTIIINSPGSESTVGVGNEKLISDIAKKGISQKKYCELLYKIGSHIKAETIIELGTSFGVSSMYLAGIDGSSVYTLEGCENTYNIARNLFQNGKFKNIKPLLGNINDTLPELLIDLKSFDLAFVDANHTFDATLTYFEELLKRSTTESVIIFDDIYWSIEMTKAWERIRNDERVSLTLDLYQVGIVFVNPDLQKENLILAY